MLLYRLSTIARAIAASATASIMTKIEIICPSTPRAPYFEKAIKFIFAEFKISSIPINTRIAFLLDIIAYNTRPWVPLHGELRARCEKMS